ncbi:hypothetical protein OQA88_11780 [Cercophora sp. LCS_1]
MATSEKANSQEQVDVTETTETNSVDVDDAWKFLDTHRDANLKEHGDIDILALRRKNDYRIVPLMFLCYTMQFIDKLTLNYAGVMTMRQELNLQGNDFSNLVTFTFVAQAAWELPTSAYHPIFVYCLQRFPAAKFLAVNVLLWGVATACGAAATNYQTLLVSRIFLGIFEATVNPSLILISSQWYTKPEQAPRFSLWLLGLGIGQIVGGAVSYGFQHIPPAATLSGWRTMFLVLGLVTVVIGIVTFFSLPDTPMQARWLTDREKVALLKHVSVNQTGIENRKFRGSEIKEALLDPQVWLLWITIVLLAGTGGIVIAYSSTLIRNLGYDSKRAALMNMPSGAISIVWTLAVGWGIRTRSHRWGWALFSILPAMVGSGLMSFLPTSNKAGILAGVYLTNTITACLSIFYNWTAANVAGATKRAFVTAMLSGLFSAGNVIGPQSFQAKDAPEYRPAKITALATQAAAACTTVLLFGYYAWKNKGRKGREKEVEGRFMDKEVWLRMTDGENKEFRYSY